MHHKEIQTADFIKTCHKHSVELWAQQNKIDGKVNKIADLRWAVMLIRNQLDLLEKNKGDLDVVGMFLLIVLNL